MFTQEKYQGKYFMIYLKSLSDLLEKSAGCNLKKAPKINNKVIHPGKC